MKYLFIMLSLCGCSAHITSENLKQDAAAQCEKVPDLDMQRIMCQYTYVTLYCKINDPDIKLCGEFKK